MQISRTSLYNKNLTTNKSSVIIKGSIGKIDGDTYEHQEPMQSPTYKINQMSQQERQALVDQMKQDQADREAQFFDIVKKSINQQTGAFWTSIAEGKIDVDPEISKKAKEDVSEDGYWGVKKTSQRLFDFACALAGDDVEKMKDMQKAMMKGVSEATKTWSKDLPDICNKTIDATNKLFDDYFAAAGDPIGDLE